MLSNGLAVEGPYGALEAWLTSAMFTLPSNSTREDVLRFICQAATYGNLGDVIGAECSKPVLGEQIGLSWPERLEQGAMRMKIDYAVIPKTGVSLPAIASKICDAHCLAVGVPYSESLSRLKRTIASLTSWYP